MKKLKKTLAVLMCLTMLFSMFPISVFAEDGDAEADSVEEADMLLENFPEDTGEDNIFLAEPALMESEESVGSAPEEAGSEPDSEAEEQPQEDTEEPQLETEDEDRDSPEEASDEDLEVYDSEEPVHTVILNTRIRKTVSSPEYEQFDNDRLFENYVYGLFYPSEVEVAGEYAGLQLTGVESTLYYTLRSYIETVAEGDRQSTEFIVPLSALGVTKTVWTAEELGVAAIFEDKEITEEATQALLNQIGGNLDLVLSALLADCPYELYWYDKVTGTVVAMDGGCAYYDPGLACDVIEISGDLVYAMSVAAGYQVGEYAVDSSTIISAKTAAANAKEMVYSYAAVSDVEKLVAYKNEICRLASYNYDALNTSVAYGNPWQLIWVFDNDSSTNVVCEGYAKAFQYLCDLTSFEGDIYCYTVTGTMTAGSGIENHMWNIVHMADGKNYLVDLTNSDDGMLGCPDSLFLTGVYYLLENGYIVFVNKQRLEYVYDSQTIALYGSSVLNVTLVSPEEELASEIAKIKQSCIAAGNTTEYEIVKFMHDYIIFHAECNLNATRVNDPEGVLIDGEGGCQSYAYAFHLLMNEMGIDCMLISGAMMFEGHIWNLVKIEGKWFHIDCAYDDPADGDENYAAFLIPDNLCSIDHYWETANYPVCVSDDYLQYDIKFSGEDDFDVQMNELADEGRFSNIIVGYTGSDAMFNVDKLLIIARNWEKKYGYKYNADGFAVWTFSEENYWRYSITYNITTQTQVDDRYDGVDGDYAYREEENAITIVQYLGSEKDVVIPAYIAGKQVTHIGNSAFWKNENIETVELPDTVQVIDDGSDEVYFYNGYCGAFKECINLRRVIIPGSVKIIGRNAFFGCYALTSVVLNEGTLVLGQDCFCLCTSLEELTLPSTIITIEQNALCETGIRSLTIPAGTETMSVYMGSRSLEAINVSDENQTYFSDNGVVYLKSADHMLWIYPQGKKDSSYRILEGCTISANDAFKDADNLEELFIPNGFNLTTFGIYPKTLNRIYIEDDNPKYKSVDGIIYSEDMTTLVCIPPAIEMDTYVMPDTVIYKNDYALYGLQNIRRVQISRNLYTSNVMGLSYCPALEEVIYPVDGTQSEPLIMQSCPNLRSVQFPSGLTSLHSNTFFECTSLKRVVLPDKLETIGQQAFCYCSSLKEIIIPPSVNAIGVNAFTSCPIQVMYMTRVPQYYSYDSFDTGKVIIVSDNIEVKNFADSLGFDFALMTSEQLALGHMPSEAVRENEVPATCTSEGSYEEVVYCTVCHEELSREKKTIEKLAHTPGEAVREKEKAATCTAEGSYEEVVYCTVCHEELSREKKTIEKIPHETELVGAKEATETEEGYTGDLVCKVCGEVFEQGTVTPVLWFELPEDLALDKSYILLTLNGTSDELTVSMDDEALQHRVRWTTESGKNNIITVVNGVVTAKGPGMDYVVATLSNGEESISARCRVDVLDEKKQGGTPIEASLPVTKITTELLKTDYARIPVVLTLKQNSMNPADVKLSDGTVLEDTGVMIEEATFIGGGKADIRTAFALRVADDRNLELVPIVNVKDAAAVKAVAGSYKSAIHLKLSNGTETDTAVVTVTVKKSQPKLTAKPVTVNSFITGQTVPVEITGGRVSSVKKQDLGFATLNSDLTVTVKDGNTKNASKTVTLSVQPDDWAVATTLKITVKNQYKAPKVALKPASVTVNRSLGDTAAAAVAVTPLEGMNHTISASGVSGLTAWYDDSTESVMVSSGTAAAGKTAYKVPVKADGKTVAYLSVKVVDASAGISAKVSGAIDPAVKNSPAVITVTGKNYNAASGTYQVEIRQNGKTVNSDLFRISQNGNIIRITAGAKTPADGKYTATVSCEIGSAKEVSFTVKTSKKVPAMTATLKAEGNIDILRGTGRILVTPTIKNRYDYDENKLGLNLPKGLTWEYKNGRFIVTAIPGANINPAVKTATLTLDGKTISKAVNLTLKQSKVTVSQSTKAVTLSKQDRYDRQSVILSLSDSTLQGIRDVTLTGGNGVLKLTPLGNGEYAIGYTNSKLPADIAKLKSTSVKLNVFLQGNGGAKADATLSVKVTFA